MNRKFRLLSLFGEHVTMTLLCAPVAILLFPIQGNWGFYGLMVIYLNKDFLNGRSPLKRLLNTQVQNQAGAPANKLQCFVRNITCFMWPLEVLLVVVSGRKRLGDYIAGTQVVDVPKNASSWRQDLAAYRVTSDTLYTLLATVLYVLLVHAFFGWLGL